MKLFLVLLATLGFSFSVFAQEGQVTQESQTVEAARAKKDSKKNNRGPASAKKKKDKKKKKKSAHTGAHKSHKKNNVKASHENKTQDPTASVAPETMDPIDSGAGMNPTAEEFQ